MSMAIEELIITAKKLANRLKDDELKADILISQSKNMHAQIEAMKEYSEDVEKLNEAASQRPYSVLVAGLQRESQHLRELQAENCELRNALRDYQNAIELIMSKYRQQVSQLMSGNKVDSSGFHNTLQCTKVILDQYTQINEMRQVMRKAAEADEECAVRDQELMSRLITENKVLRELLNISKKYGSQDILKEDASNGEVKEELKTGEKTESEESPREKECDATVVAATSPKTQSKEDAS